MTAGKPFGDIVVIVRDVGRGRDDEMVHVSDFLGVVRLAQRLAVITHRLRYEHGPAALAEAEAALASAAAQWPEVWDGDKPAPSTRGRETAAPANTRKRWQPTP